MKAAEYGFSPGLMHRSSAYTGPLVELSGKVRLDRQGKTFEIPYCVVFVAFYSLSQNKATGVASAVLAHQLQDSTYCTFRDAILPTLDAKSYYLSSLC